MVSSLLLLIVAAVCKSVRNDCVTHVYLEGAESSWSGEAVKASHVVACVREADVRGGSSTAYSFAKDFRECLGVEERARMDAHVKWEEVRYKKECENVTDTGSVMQHV